MMVQSLSRGVGGDGGGPQRVDLSLVGMLPMGPESSTAGIDEVGRGALFGPVVAAAVILPPELPRELVVADITDSKALSPDRRLQLAVLIEALGIDCQIGVASVAEIDQLNILHASLLAMRRAIQKLGSRPSLCLVDGNQTIPQLSLPQRCIVGGDRQVLAIAAASIVAKVWRDQLIQRLDSLYPGYDLARNKGYGTLDHRRALEYQGLSRLHRVSFRPCQRLQARRG